MKYLVLTFLLVTVVPAQQYEIINSAQGLSQNEVFSIYEDSKGFLWFGTQDGLNRYDGYTFRIYRPQPGNTNSLVDYAINSIAEDRNKNLWIATRDGLNKFNPQTDEFTLYKQNDTNGLSSNYVWKVLADGDDLWIAAREGLDKLHIPSGTFSHYKSDSADVNSISNKIVRDMLREGNTLWSATMNGLNALDLETGIVKKFFHVPGDIKNLSSRSLDCLAFDRRFGIWAGSANGLNLVRFDGSVNSFSFFGTGELNYILDILVDQSGILWLGTRGGIVNFNPLDGSYRKYSDINDIVRVLHQDRSGIIWAGSIGKGIIKVNTDPSRCGITGNFQGPVYSFYEDENGRILAGGRGSILVFKNNLVFSEYKKAVTPDNIFSIVSDNKKNYLAGTFGGGISVYDRNLRPLKRITASDFPGFSNNFIHAIYRDRKGVLWIGTGQGGLVMYREKENDFVSFQTDPGNSESINSNEVTCITEDDKGFLWLGTTTGGINKFDPLKGTFTGYIHDQENEKSVTSNRINTLFIDRNNNLWAGTFGGGLLKLIGDNEFRHYGSDDGLNGNSVFSIEEDDSGNLWMSTEKGISLFDPASGVFTNFDAADGLQDGNFYANSSIKTSGGYMVFGGSGGINYFHPDSIKNSSYLSPVVFTDFRVFNNSVPVGKHDGNDFYLDKNISYREEIEIPWNKNVFSLEFSSLHYAYPAKNMYAYKMEGFDNDWIYSGTRRFVTYTNLDPGNYIFRVRGTNSDGVWNPVESLLQIKIIPPWWKTWWAYILYTLVLAAVLYVFRKYEMHRIKLKNELEIREFEARKLQEVDQMKSRFFANISHEFRTPLTLITGLLEKQLKKNDNEDFRIMKKNARRLLQLINQLLELSKVESGYTKIQVSKTALLPFLKRSAALFLSYAEQKDIKIRLNNLDIASVQSEDEIFVYFDCEKMETVFYNLLSNAVKFTPAEGMIYIDTVPGKWQVEINVTNTGTGISLLDQEKIFDRFYRADDSGTRKYEGTGIGLALVKEYVELHKGEVSVRSIPGKETTFSVRLPLGRAHFRPEEVFEITEPVIPLIPQVKITPASGEDKLPDLQRDIILVVEDHQDLRNFIKSQLEDTYNIIEAGNGGEGFEIAEKIIPDLVISDIMMPVMDGNALCAKIKSSPKTSHIPVILLTARASLEDKIEGLDTGADDYLVKPFNTEELKARVRNLINLRQVMREKFQSEMILKPAEIIVNSSQKNFIEKLTGIIEKNMHNESFGIEKLCNEIGMSRTQLHRKIKALTNQTTTEFIRNFRLKRAAELISKDAGNMAEIAYKVGFNSQSYFTKSFQELFGLSPSDYKKNPKEPA